MSGGRRRTGDHYDDGVVVGQAVRAVIEDGDGTFQREGMSGPRSCLLLIVGKRVSQSRIRDEPGFSGHVPTILTALVEGVELVVRLAADARVASTVLNELTPLLSAAHIRPDPSLSISRFVSHMRRELATLESGLDILGERPGATVADLRQAAAWIIELHQEIARSTHLSEAVAPGPSPLGVTVESSLSWALRLSSVGLPATLIAHFAEHLTQTDALHGLLQASQRHRAALYAARATGMVRGDWLSPASGIEATRAQATRFGATLSQAQVIADGVRCRSWLHAGAASGRIGGCSSHGFASGLGALMDRAPRGRSVHCSRSGRGDSRHDFLDRKPPVRPSPSGGAWLGLGRCVRRENPSLGSTLARG